MSDRRPSFVPGMVLAQVSLRVILPLLGGAIAGLVADGFGQTAPQFVLIGMAAGTLVSVLWLRAFVVSNVSRMRQEHGDPGAQGGEEDEHSTTKRT